MDFHALRHTCGAWLAMSGVHPKVVQTVMRHSTITLTMDTYGHLFPGQEAEAISRFSLFMGTRLFPLAATGPEDNTPELCSARSSSGGAAQYILGATPCNDEAEAITLSMSKNTKKLAARCDPMPSGTMLCDPFASLAQLAEQLTLNQ